MTTGLDVQDVARASRKHIMSSLTPANVADEVTSSFASTYPDIRDDQMKYIEEHYVRVQHSSGKVYASLIGTSQEEVCKSDSFRQLVQSFFVDTGAAEGWLRLLRRLRVPN
jgi:hypothetical protein